MNGDRTDTISPQPFASFENAVLNLYKPPMRARSTFEGMARVLRELAALAPPPATTADLTTELVLRFIEDRRRSVCVNTVIGELSYLRSLCSFAFDEGWLNKNPFRRRRLRLRCEPPTNRKYHTLSDVAKVLTHLRSKAETGDWMCGRLFAAAATVAYTGLRRNEALRLMVEDVVLSEGLLLVVARAGNRLKTAASAQPVPIPPELRPILEAWIPRSGSVWLFPTRHRKSPWTGGNPGTKPLDRLKQGALEVGVAGFTWLSLRHSWATHAESAWGLTEGGIRRILRHTTDLTSHHYRHADAANLRALGRQVSILGGASATDSGGVQGGALPCPE